MILPEPTYVPPDPTKKSHAKKQPTGHIPRPRNAFILFRCDYVRQGKIPANVEKDHRNISRIVGKIWRQMNDEQREPWVLMASRERVAHSKLHPSYRFSSGVSKNKLKRGDDIPRETQKSEDHHIWGDSDLLDFYSSSSSRPPGALYVPQANLESCTGYGAPFKTTVDISTPEEGDPAARFCRPRITPHTYPTPGPNGPPEWGIVPTQTYNWTDWSTFQIDQPSSGGNTGGILQIDALKPFFIDPFLSTLPPLPHPCDSKYEDDPISFSLQPSFSASQTGVQVPTTYPPSEACILSYGSPEYVENIAKYHSIQHPPIPK